MSSIPLPEYFLKIARFSLRTEDFLKDDEDLKTEDYSKDLLKSRLKIS